jgi:hypothetical protein
MSKISCKFCGSKQTNRGSLKHYGRYRGFECRTWIADEGGHGRSAKCHAREAVKEVLAEVVAVGT